MKMETKKKRKTGENLETGMEKTKRPDGMNWTKKFIKVCTKKGKFIIMFILLPEQQWML